MVAHQEFERQADDVFQALAHATRRDILRRSSVGDMSISQLAQEYDMSFAAVQKHVAVLERAGLVSKQQSGREQLVKAEARALLWARQALDDLEATWRGRVDRITGLLANEKPEE